MARGPHHSHNPGPPPPATCGGVVSAESEQERRAKKNEERRNKKEEGGLPEVGESGEILESRGGELTLTGIDRQVGQVRQLGHEPAL